MIIPDQGRPSYARGFARSQAEAVYPGLWNGLAGYWHPPLGATGLTLHDHSGRGRNGTLTNMEAASDWLLTEHGYALEVDGVDEHVLLPDDILGGATQWSVGGWINLSALGDDESPFLGSGFVQFPMARQDGVTGTWQIYAGEGAASFVNAVDTATAMVVNTWYHFMLVYDGTTNFKAYINGVEDQTSGTVTADKALPATDTGGCRFGGGFGSSVEALHGRIGPMGAWRRPLSANEVRALYGDWHAVVRPAMRLWVQAPAAGGNRRRRMILLGAGA